MTSSSVEWTARFRQAREEIDALLRQGADARRAERTTAILRSCWPSAVCYACVLRQESQAAALDESGSPRPEWAETIRAATGPPLSPEALNLPGRFLAWEEIRFRDKVYGALAAAVPGDDAVEFEAARTFLAFCAQSLGAGLAVETLEREREALAEEAAGNRRLADLGELSAPIAHEFNNFLNALLLHVAVLQIKLPEALQAGLAEVRQQAMGAAALIQQFQHYRQRRPPQSELVDLNRAVRSGLQALGGEVRSEDNELSATVHIHPSPGTADAAASPGVSVFLDLAAGELPLLGTVGDLKRLCIFLVRNAAGAAAANGGDVAVRTARGEDQFVLRVEDAGPPMTAEQRTHLYESAAPGREGTNSLELAACKALVRRLQGTIRGENRLQGGVAFIVEWKAATP